MILIDPPHTHTHTQTIKCLLIYPNPESALNEEAGKMLLEQYDDYSSRAQMMTDIHAKPLRSSATAYDTVLNRMEGVASIGGVAGEAVQVIPDRKKTADKTTVGVNDKKKKDKKKALKRL